MIQPKERRFPCGKYYGQIIFQVDDPKYFIWFLKNVKAHESIYEAIKLKLNEKNHSY